MVDGTQVQHRQGWTEAQHRQGFDHSAQQGFHHSALFYRDEDEFLAATVPFVRDAVAAEEPVLAVLDADGIRLLQGALNGEAESVRFADMGEVGRNPARIIPAWREFVDEQGAGARAMRGIGEPVCAHHSPAELAECQRHESLLNLAFADATEFSLLCPYDTASLEDVVLEEARRSHPHVAEGGTERQSPSYDAAASRDPFWGVLPDPAGDPVQMTFTIERLNEVRGFVSVFASRAGLDPQPLLDAVMAANELATNSIRHAGGKGSLRLWQENGTLICEVRDAGRFTDPLAGRRRPTPTQASGRGLWITNQLCDLVQIRSSPAGSVVRIHIHRS
jgi:anti-sigma regulatory factor (Ser/Thr protein kinase)